MDSFFKLQKKRLKERQHKFCDGICHHLLLALVFGSTAIRQFLWSFRSPDTSVCLFLWYIFGAVHENSAINLDIFVKHYVQLTWVQRCLEIPILVEEVKKSFWRCTLQLLDCCRPHLHYPTVRLCSHSMCPSLSQRSRLTNPSCHFVMNY